MFMDFVHRPMVILNTTFRKVYTFPKRYVWGGGGIGRWAKSTNMSPSSAIYHRQNSLEFNSQLLLKDFKPYVSYLLIGSLAINSCYKTFGFMVQYL
jgi:hypothetical protein